MSERFLKIHKFGCLSGIQSHYLPRVPNLLQKSFANAFSGKGFCLLFDRLQKVRRGVQGQRKCP
jgi:hypothetical protein